VTKEADPAQLYLQLLASCCC